MSLRSTDKLCLALYSHAGLLVLGYFLDSLGFSADKMACQAVRFPVSKLDASLLVLDIMDGHTGANDGTGENVLLTAQRIWKPQ